MWSVSHNLWFVVICYCRSAPHVTDEMREFTCTQIRANSRDSGMRAHKVLVFLGQYELWPYHYIQHSTYCTQWSDQ